MPFPEHVVDKVVDDQQRSQVAEDEILQLVVYVLAQTFLVEVHQPQQEGADVSGSMEL